MGISSPGVWWPAVSRWYGLEEDPFNTLSGLQLSAEVAHKWYTLRKTLKMPAQIPILCRTDGGGPAGHGHVRCADAKKGLYRLVEPDYFPTKLFDNETAGILRCLPKAVLASSAKPGRGTA